VSTLHWLFRAATDLNSAEIACNSLPKLQPILWWECSYAFVFIFVCSPKGLRPGPTQILKEMISFVTSIVRQVSLMADIEFTPGIYWRSVSCRSHAGHQARAQFVPGTHLKLELMARARYFSSANSMVLWAFWSVLGALGCFGLFNCFARKGNEICKYFVNGKARHKRSKGLIIRQRSQHNFRQVQFQAFQATQTPNKCAFSVPWSEVSLRVLCCINGLWIGYGCGSYLCFIILNFHNVSNALFKLRAIKWVCSHIDMLSKRLHVVGWVLMSGW
jgi:hypothetical protein